MNAVKKLKQEADVVEQGKKVSKPEEEKAPFYSDVLFWVRVGVGLIFLMVLVSYLFF